MIHERIHKHEPPIRPSDEEIPVEVTEAVLLLQVPFRWLSASTFAEHLDAAVARGSGGYACEVCASSLIEASRDARFMRALVDADANLPDGAPVAWAVGRLLGRRQERMPGPQVMLDVLAHASRCGYKVLLYGSTPTILGLLERRLTRLFPKLNLTESISPPFGRTSAEDDDTLCDEIRSASPDLVLVALGAPKQEIWMREHRDRLPAYLIGVGAAFEYNAGLINRAPPWMQDLGLEWLCRLAQQPRRVGTRLATTLPIFAYRAALAMLLHEARAHSSAAGER
jgi:N-acetylglucosaminyldiphosphoundecaprenol N-acetyl-beta-D-mannosaminyltransferase